MFFCFCEVMILLKRIFRKEPNKIRNIFTTKTESIIDCVPDSSWLLPKNKCIAEYILPLIDNDTFSIMADDNPKLTNEQWRLQQPYVEKYIRPCHSHPNQAGHQKIAQEIIKLLTNE